MITFIAWEKYNRRSDLLAQHLGATMHHVALGQRGKILAIPSRFIAQARHTWQILLQERPEVVFVQNPPIFCVMVAYAYSRRYDAKYFIDSHSAAFNSLKWRWSLGFHKILSRRAAATIVHNEFQSSIAKRWGCGYCVLGDPLGDFPLAEDYPFAGDFNIAVISTPAYDEPLEIVLQAACRLPEIKFYVTGDSRRVDPRLLARKPDNCCFTGYLPFAQYGSLLRGADFVLDLTTRDHTLLSGAFEAVSVGTPMIISDWAILRDYYPLGTVHIPNTMEGVFEGIRRAQRDQSSLKRDIVRMREILQGRWEKEFKDLQALLNGRA